VNAAFDPGPKPSELDALLGELPTALLDEESFRCCELTDRYATEVARDLAVRLGISAPLALGATIDELVARGGFVESFRPALEALLRRLVDAGDVERSFDDGERYRTTRPITAIEREPLRAFALRVEPRSAPTFDLLDTAADAYPAVARGETSGEQELFAAGRIQLWLDYFSNDNPGYVLNNRLAAFAAANRIEAVQSPRVLEIGAGAGSATRALLAELARRGRLDELPLYDFTEPSPFFRRRGERELRALHPDLPLRVRSLDIDRPLAAQGFEPGSYDLVFGVNVLHVAQRLDWTLRELGALLAPRGWLVGGECLRPYDGQSVPADLVFQLLTSFTGVATDPQTRPRHGFLEAASWRRAFDAAGFGRVEIVPDLERIREIYPRFFTGVICARRTAEP
jgi:SAM-dependent methyltransferase